MLHVSFLGASALYYSLSLSLVQHVQTYKTHIVKSVSCEDPRCGKVWFLNLPRCGGCLDLESPGLLLGFAQNRHISGIAKEGGCASLRHEQIHSKTTQQQLQHNPSPRLASSSPLLDIASISSKTRAATRGALLAALGRTGVSKANSSTRPEEVARARRISGEELQTWRISGELWSFGP